MKAEMTVSVRPVRHVYFIGEDDLERFTEVACYCCSQWGGINNLIIPVKLSEIAPDKPFPVNSYHEFLMECRNPDIFVDAISDKVKDDSNSIHDELKKYLAVEFPGKNLHRWETFIHYDHALHPLSILSPQNVSPKPELAIAGFLPGFSSSTSNLNNAIIDAVFGRIWPEQTKDYEETYTFKGWDTSNPDKFLYQQLSTYPYASVINLTLKDLHNGGTEIAFPSLFFDVVIAKTVLDICHFWNLRSQSSGHNWLVDRRVLILSKEQLLQKQEIYFKSLVRLLKERRSHAHIETNIDVIFHHYYDPEVQEFLQSHDEFQRHEGPLQSSIHDERKESSSEATTRPLTYKEDSIADFCVYHEYGGIRPTFSQELKASSETFLIPNMGPKLGSIGEAYIGLQSDFWEQLPCHQSVANLIVPNASLNVFLNTIELSYPLMLTQRGMERITMNIPKTWDIYTTYFRSKGYEVSPSDKMPYAHGLVRRAGGFEQENVKVLRTRVAREILDLLTDKATTKLAREIIRILNLNSSSENDLQQIIANLEILPQNQRVPRAFGDISSQVKGKPELSNLEKKTCLQTLSQLVKIKVVQRGMYIKCSSCGTKTWYGIYALDEQIRCNGCLETFDLPLTENESDGIERPFQYSLNPLANQAMDQDVLPVIAALLTLKTHHQAMHHPIMGMNFQKTGNTNRDGDFDFIYIHKHELYGGECKSGGKFTIKDINTAKLAQLLGFRAFFFAAMRPIEAGSQILIDEYKQELANNKDDEHPFDIFVLDDRMLFGEASLPNNIP